MLERADALHEHFLQRRVGDLEAKDIPAMGDGRFEHVLRVARRIDMELGVVLTGPRDRDVRERPEPVDVAVTARREAHRLAAASFPLLLGAASAFADSPIVPLEWQHKLHGSPWDANDNQVDDELEAFPSTSTVDTILDLTDCPNAADKARLVTFGTLDLQIQDPPILALRGVLVSRLTTLAADPIVARNGRPG